MINNYGRLVDAFRHLNEYYNKIIFVDLKKDSFEICKISSDEWDQLNVCKFSDWVEKFSMSNDLHNYDRASFIGFMQAFKEGCFVRPATLYYQKKIDKKWHTVFLEVLPIGDSKYYILVKDFTLMEG